ncbi:hypothetical protein NE237_010428 [Protea cynaroides]|uniref:Protein kinase domain-containing protein n=1 Tax=Protea cynaroides TaxID=273540 RepID=A0A9Q0R189_9MAGN|nr:hypothetical protein NE237_010428 [Protea cynaroides]
MEKSLEFTHFLMVLKEFPLETLALATRNFHYDHKLGQGEYGPVYKGQLGDGREIAVKRLSYTSRQGKEFINEAKILTRLQHKKLLCPGLRKASGLRIHCQWELGQSSLQ